MMFVMGVLSSVSPGRARDASAPLPIARDATGRLLLDRVWPFPASCAAHRSEVALHGLAVEMSRLHDDQRANCVLGDERQVEQYSARPPRAFPSGRRRPGPLGAAARQ